MREVGTLKPTTHVCVLSNVSARSVSQVKKCLKLRFNLDSHIHVMSTKKLKIHK